MSHVCGRGLGEQASGVLGFACTALVAADPVAPDLRAIIQGASCAQPLAQIEGRTDVACVHHGSRRAIVVTGAPYSLVQTSSGRSTNLQQPRSPIFTTPAFVMKMFAGCHGRDGVHQ
mgnify:CR=1 FL=1|jgi:hypothetical protein